MDLRYGLSDAWSIAAELLYATRGTDVESNGVSFGGFFFTYVELPVLARLGWPIPLLAGTEGVHR